MSQYYIKDGTLVDANELYHYGVKGMRWGVRKNAKILASNKRNRAIRDIRKQYANNEIDRQQMKTAIKKAKNDRKADIKKTMDQYEAASDKGAYKKQLSATTKKSVGHLGLKKTISAVNKIATGVSIGTAAAAAVNVGRQVVIEKILDRTY